MRNLPGVTQWRRSVVKRRAEPRVQRIIGFEIEIARDDRSSGTQSGVKRATASIDDVAQARMATPFRVDRAQRLDLGRSFFRSIVLQMRGDHAHRPERCIDHCFDRDARHAVDARIDGIGQQVPEHLTNRQARKDHVAKMPPLAVLCRNIDSDAGDGQVSGQQPREFGKLILAPAAAQQRIRIVVGDLLQTEHVEIANGLGVLDDPGRIDFAVDAPTPLHIPGNELHRIPARMKD